MQRQHLALLVISATTAFAPRARAPRSSTARAASAEDLSALSARLSDTSTVEGLFIVDGAPRQFLRREQFIKALADAPGPALSEDAAYECWLGFGGQAKPVEKKKEDKGFFGNFVAQIAENAAGGKLEDVEKDMWGNPSKNILTIVDLPTILESDASKAGFSEAALEKMLAAGGELS
mmetsp:Transcript_23362/g.69983  ORF Transcript_23362/g.69983 Transcript_23362/m.69983 type:complete len:177 (+) Transcript_23362:181-711(+)